MKQKKVIETKKCKHCSVYYDINTWDLEFYNNISPVFKSYELENNRNLIKYPILTPTSCPDCRQQKRLAFINETKLYKRKCDATWEIKVMMYKPWTKYKVYNSDYWYSDKWDPLKYWKKIDFNKGFFEQFSELFLEVPRLWRSIYKSKNSEFTNNCSYVKDSYLSFNWWDSEKILYCNLFRHCFFTVDSRKITNSNNCYECINCDRCYNLMYWENCINVQDSWYMKNCKDCNYCIACTNLVWKNYCIENKQYTELEYKKLKSEYIIKYSREEFKRFCSNHFVRALNNEDSKNVEWNNITNSKNIFHSFNIDKSNNVKYSYDLRWINTNVMDVNSFWWNIHNCFESCTIWHDSNYLLFCNQVYGHCNNLIYCDSCFWCSNCFWCTWLKNKQYCILNVQYTHDEYEELVQKIIKIMFQKWEWWEFFPASMSPFWYNETLAQEYFKLTKKEALKQWFNWSDYEVTFAKVEKTIEWKKLSRNTNEIPDDIVNWAIICEISHKPFRISPIELEFYRKHNLPLPIRHPDIRHEDRLKLKSPRKIFERNCDKCSKRIKSNYAVDLVEKVYCEECYDIEVNK